MNGFFEFVEKRKFGILAALAVYLFLFVYMNLGTYQKYYVIPIWDERAQLESPEIQIKPENIEVDQQTQFSGDIKSIAQDLNDKRTKSYENWSQNKTSQQAEQRVKDLEKQFFEESGGAQKRAEIQKKTLDNKQKQNENSQKKNENTTTGGDIAYKGSVMVSWVLADREPHQNNNWYVRNPGYTCGSDAAGKVAVRIRVNQAGRVIQANHQSQESANVTSCMVEQALKYARMSRFNYSGSASKSQEGMIYYTFVAQ